MLADRTSQIIVCILIAVVCFFPTTVVTLWNRSRLIRRELNDDESVYFVRYSVFLKIVGIVGTIFCYGVTVLAFITLDGDLIASAIFFAFTMLGVFSWLGSMLWEIKVDSETLTFYRFPLPVKQIRFSEITNVRFLHKVEKGLTEGRIHIVGYGNGKKLFDIDSDMENFERLFQRFESERHPERAYFKEGGKEELLEVQESFSVTETLANRLRAAFCFVFFAGLFILFIIALKEFRQEGPDYYPILFIASFLIFVLEAMEFIRVMVWKLTVNYRTIRIRSAFGGTYSLTFDDIAALETKELYSLLHVNGRKPIKVRMSYKNYALLEERVLRELNQRELDY